MSITDISERAMKPNADPEATNSFLPLQPYEFHVLMVLSDQQRHGYGIRRATLERTGGKMRLDPGVLYRTLRRLKEAGLIAESDKRPAEDLDDQRRRYYGLTELGRRVARAEAERLEDLIVLARESDLLRDRGRA